MARMLIKNVPVKLTRLFNISLKLILLINSMTVAFMPVLKFSPLASIRLLSVRNFSIITIGPDRFSYISSLLSFDITSVCSIISGINKRMNKKITPATRQKDTKMASIRGTFILKMYALLMKLVSGRSMVAKTREIEVYMKILENSHATRINPVAINTI